MTWIRSVWKALIAALSTLAATVLASISDSLTQIDWTKFDRDVIVRAIVLGAITGIGVWAKANRPVAEQQMVALTKAADAARAG